MLSSCRIRTFLSEPDLHVSRQLQRLQLCNNRFADAARTIDVLSAALQPNDHQKAQNDGTFRRIVGRRLMANPMRL